MAQAAAAHAQTTPTDLAKLSIEELGNIQVTSVSKRAQSLSSAPSAVYVITHDDIVRSGATRLPEILRLAPNLFVAQTGAGNYVVTARGFNGNQSDQAFSDKLLVLIDGRSVYTPLFSGVYWDMQDVLPEDIERIEVISGPGATLWGANAVNGVINIITRAAAESQGLLVEADGGNRQDGASVRFGGKVGDAIDYRVYARAQRFDHADLANGDNAADGWSHVQGGFRLDWAASRADAVTFQGDAIRGTEKQLSSFDGGNLMGRWIHSAENGSTLQVQAYVDREQRGQDLSGGTPFWINTYDLDVQQSFNLGTRNAVVWGAGVRLSRYTIAGTPTLQFDPRSRTLDLSNLFVQDTITLVPTVNLIVGLKLENDPFSDLSALPNVRLSWTPNAAVLVWAAASQAIRSPTPFDRDVRESTGGASILGAPNFAPEKLTAYELGVRLRPSPKASLSVSAYYNLYDDLRSIEITPVTVFPLTWGGSIRGHTYGVDAWGSYQLAPWWRLSAGLDLLGETLQFAPGASGAFLGLNQEGDDPTNQETLRSSMDLPHDVTFDADLRHVAALPNPHVPPYTEMNARIGWNVTRRLQVSLVGFNLLHERHMEMPAPALAVPRSVYAELKWGF